MKFSLETKTIKMVCHKCDYKNRYKIKYGILYFNKLWCFITLARKCPACDEFMYTRVYFNGENQWKYIYKEIKKNDN